MERRGGLVHHFLERSAAARPDAVAVTSEGRRATYAEVNAAANRTARELTAAGVEPGDRVALLAENGLPYVAAYYGILKSGAVVVSLNTALKTAALRSLLEEVRPRATLVTSRLRPVLRALDAAALGPGGPRTIDPPPAEGPGDDPGTALRPEDPAAIVYTSGSSGKPRGVVLTHRNIAANTESIVRYLDLTPGDVQMVVLPFFYVMGLSLLNTHVAAGGRVVINNQFAYPAAVLKQMAEEGVTGFSGVPSTYAYLLFRSPLAEYRDRLPALRYCSQAGGHMPRPVKLRLLEALPPRTRLFVMYGATEAAARLSYVPPDRLAEKIDSIGVPIPGVSLRVLSGAGEELGPGEVGELVARGENIMAGYYRDPEATARVLDGAGYHTGDLAYRDDEGFFYVVGRKDCQVKVGGHRVDPQEVEDVIVESGRVVECIVFGVPDPLMGHRLAGLAVPLRSGPGEMERVLAHCESALPRYKVPLALLPVEAVPKNSNGKPDREESLRLFGRLSAESPAMPASRRHGCD